MALTAKKQQFVAEYLIDLNATQAAIRAGYSAKTAYASGSRMLRNVEVQSAISEAQAARAERTHITQDRVLLEVARLSFCDMRKFFNADGSLKPPHELDDDAAAALAGIDVVEMAGGAKVDGDGGVSHTQLYTKKVKVFDKNSSLTLAMRHLGMLKEKVELTGEGGGPMQQVVAVVDEKKVSAVVAKLNKDF
jgi:phage terminase small subunit